MSGSFKVESVAGQSLMYFEVLLIHIVPVRCRSASSDRIFILLSSTWESYTGAAFPKHSRSVPGHWQ